MNSSVLRAHPQCSVFHPCSLHSTAPHPIRHISFSLRSPSIPLLPSAGLFSRPRRPRRRRRWRQTIFPLLCSTFTFYAPSPRHRHSSALLILTLTLTLTSGSVRYPFDFDTYLYAASNNRALPFFFSLLPWS